MNLIVSAAIVLLNPYVTVYISYKIPPFALSVHIPDVSTSIYVEVDSKVLLGLPSCDKVHIPADTRSAFPVISVHSPVSIQYRWQS